MQKKLLALAVASVVSAPVFAQSQVSVYGVVDVGIEVAKFNRADGTINRMISSGNTTNRLGFKGTEDLGNGLKANFVLEGQPFPDSGTQNEGGAFWHRTATVGLSSNSWGSVNLGSQYTPWFSARGANDIFYTAGAGSNYNFEGGDTRMSNSIRYDSPSFNGFSIAAMYGMGETNAAKTLAAYNGQEGLTDATQDIGRSAGLSLAYANGPIAVRYAYDQQTMNLADEDLKRNHVNGSYDFKVVKIVAGWNQAKQDGGSVDLRSWYIGGVMPVFGKDLVKLEYTDLKDKTSTAATGSKDSNMIALGYEHFMSKRTVLYATYAKLNNDNGARNSFLTGPGPTEAGGVTLGYDPSSFQMGLKHSF